MAALEDDFARAHEEKRRILYAGWLLGLTQSPMSPPLVVCPVMDDEGGFTGEMTLDLPGCVVISFTLPSPPTEWDPRDVYE